MGKVVKGGQEDPKPSCSTALTSRKTLAEQQEVARSLIVKHDTEELWDHIQSKDVPAEIVDFVVDHIKLGTEHSGIRRMLGIPRSTDKQWKKIMLAVRGGVKVDSTALAVHILGKMQRLGDKLYAMTEEAMESGVETLTKDGGVVKLKGLNSEITGAIDAYNRLQQGTLKTLKEVGIIADASENKQQGQGGGITINVTTNVPNPTMKDIQLHQAKMSQVANPTFVLEDVRDEQQKS